MARALFFLVIIGLAVYALADIATSDEGARRGLPKGAWFLIALVPIAGPLVWILSTRAQPATGGAGPAQGRRPGPGGSGGSAPRRPGPVAPDDDPEFLWRLDQERRRRERENGTDGGSNGDVPDEGARG
jgi:hypothetical protein